MTKTLKSIILITGAIGCLCSPKTARSEQSILCVGDSITCGRSKPDVPGGYRAFLEELFASEGTSVKFLGSRVENSTAMIEPYHEGWPGYRIEQIACAALPTLFEARADIVLILAGTNDVRQGFALNQAPARLEVLISLASKLQPNSRVLVGSLPLLLFDEKHPKQVEALEAFNAALPNVIERCRSRGLRVELVDLYHALSPGDIVADTVHPNASGYKKLGKAWFDAIKATPR